MTYTTLLEAITAYKSSKKAQTESAINRYLLPAFGLKLSSTRINSEEVKQAQELMATIKLSEITSVDLIALLEKNFECANLKKGSQRYPRSYIKSFIDFLIKHNSIKANIESNSNKLINKCDSYKPLRRRKSSVLDKAPIVKSKIKLKSRIILNFEPAVYLKDFELKYPSKEHLELLDIIKDYLNKISDDINQFESFLFSNLRVKEVTARHDREIILRLLGWLYQQGTDLSNLTFTAVVPVINTNFDISSFERFDYFLVEEGKKRYEAKREADKVVNFLKKFFLEYKVFNSGTKTKYIKAIVNLAKYLYKDITDDSEAANYEDIPVINKLRVFQRKIPKQSQLITSLPLTWSEILKVRERLRLDANETSLRHIKVIKGKKHLQSRGKRGKVGIAISLMRFLTLSLLTVVPPDRSRTYRELEIGKTFKHGLFNKAGFIPKDLLLNPNDAKYYFHLMPEDYKTGDCYGEFIGEIPNTTFEDGNGLYDYLNRWLYEGYREVLLRQEKHNFLFPSSREGKPFTETGFGSFVSSIFKNKAQIFTNPHKLRHIFCSYMDEIKAPLEEREAAAFWMHHSAEMAKTTYTIREVQDKLQPSISLMVRMNNLS